MRNKKASLPLPSKFDIREEPNIITLKNKINEIIKYLENLQEYEDTY